MSQDNNILEGLSAAQREAVVNYDGPTLIIAGAGSGKTRVLTTRIAYMLAQGVDPSSILALTFTNKAAREMRERIEKLVGPKARFIRMGTFHSVFARLLRENAAKLGYPESYTIYEPTDVKNLVKTIVKEMNLSEERYKPQAVAARISMAKNSLVTPAAYRANAVLVGEDRELKMPEFSDIYAEYCIRCKRNGAMDFDDLLLQTNILLRDAPEVLEQYAVIGSVYASEVLGQSAPRVALLNIGEESSKGNAHAKVAYQLMSQAAEGGRYNFVGNIEPSHIFTGDVADVIVCDGFVGNTVLKLTEGLYSITASEGALTPFWQGLNYEQTGGTPVLGVGAVVTIGHGKSTPKAIKNMILSTLHSVKIDLVGKLREKF